MISDLIYKANKEKNKLWAVLIDPSVISNELLDKYIKAMKQTPPSIILVGGSLLLNNADNIIKNIKAQIPSPIVLFPGHTTQISKYADAILFLSLISGRNPEYLIGQQVIAAPLLKETNMEIIPTGYILIDGGKTTSVEYISNTRPIPAGKTDIAKATALAGQYIGHKLIYLEAGSGANHHITTKMVKEVAEYIDIPLIVGGGITSTEEAKTLYQAGATCLVIGSYFEQNPEKIVEFAKNIDK